MFTTSHSGIPALLTMLVVSTSTFTSSVVHAANNALSGTSSGNWAIHLDNDLLASSDRDQDYTGGFTLALPAAERAGYAQPLSIEPLQNRLNDLVGITGINERYSSRNFRSIDFGVALFTPANISASEPLETQHPYASLFFINNTQQSVLPAQRLSVTSMFSVGILGLSLGGELQRELHQSTGSAAPRGWDHQISEGGELTARYALGAQKNLLASRLFNGAGLDINLTGQFSVGYTTEATTGINARIGLTRSPWWTFNPHQSSYTKLSTPAALSYVNSRPEAYFYVGAQARYMAYSAFLQGQFRQSDVVFKSDELEKMLYESWAGVALQLNKGVSADLFIRSRSASIKADADSDITWGGLAFKFST